MKGRLNVLLTAIGCPGGPSIIDGLRIDPRVSIVGTDIRDEVPGKYLVDKFYRVPSGQDKNYINSMLDIVKKEKIDVILPLATYELESLAANACLFNKFKCNVCVSELPSLKVANNRFSLYEYFRGEDYIPKYYAPKDMEEMQKKMKEMGFPNNKVVVKPFTGHGSRGVRIINNNVNLYEEYINNKPGSIEMTYRIFEEIFKNQKEIRNIMLTEYLPGKEYGVDLLIDPFSRRTIFGMTRDNGNVSSSEVSNGKVVNNSVLINNAIVLAETLKLKYTVNLDFKCDYKGIPKLLEINPRLPATSFLATSVGCNLPLYSIYLAVGEKFSSLDIESELRIYSYRGFMVVNEMNEVINRC